MSKMSVTRIGIDVIPDDIQEKSIREIIADGDTNISVKKGYFKAQKKMSDKLLTIQVKDYSGLKLYKGTSILSNKPDSEKREIAKKLSQKERWKQEDIANALGKSQSTISRWLKK